MHFNALAPTRPSRHQRLPPAFCLRLPCPSPWWLRLPARHRRAKYSQLTPAPSRPITSYRHGPRRKEAQAQRERPVSRQLEQRVQAH